MKAKEVPRMTLAEHRQFGEELLATRELLMRRYAEVAEKYGKTTARRLSPAIRSVDSMRSKMDDIACIEYLGQIGDTFTELYYPPTKP